MRWAKLVIFVLLLVGCSSSAVMVEPRACADVERKPTRSEYYVRVGREMVRCRGA